MEARRAELHTRLDRVLVIDARFPWNGVGNSLVRWLTPKLTRTPRGLRTVRTGYAYQPPACCTYQRRRAACPEAPRTVRTPYAYQPRAYRTYRVAP